ncbi:MAG: hypothetical protein H7A23_15625 [Leptospiraceae bacterium]|nr:hypothetical protein [Leptospiraceae bacterium]MCP5495980.1 hypothetical protein [Leptospiraceae bacterium]
MRFSLIPILVLLASTYSCATNKGKFYQDSYLEYKRQHDLKRSGKACLPYGVYLNYRIECDYWLELSQTSTYNEEKAYAEKKRKEKCNSHP